MIVGGRIEMLTWRDKSSEKMIAGGRIEKLTWRDKISEIKLLWEEE